MIEKDPSKFFSNTAMVPVVPDSTLHPQASSTSVPTAEEEALKRNTDCVYFLASPLTCKKGSECEYRHSEYARVNPRDCWYWFNASCLNLKCSFRHPPLDGLLGAQASSSVGASLPPQQIAVPPSVHNSHNSSGRQPVPCVFFQKGHCMKGDKCSFLHGTNPVGNKVQLAASTMLTGDLSSTKKPWGFLQKCSQEQKVPADSSKPPGPTSSTRLVRNAGNGLPGKVPSFEKSAPLARNIGEEASRCKPSHPSPVVNGSSQIRPGRMHQTLPFDERSIQYDKEADEVLRESSPGFDVLVDDELGDSEYFHGEDQFGRMRTHDRRNLGSVDEYDMDHPADYSSLPEADREMLRDRRAFQSFDHMPGMYGWDQLRNPSEVMVGDLSHREGRNHVKSGSPDRFDGSDLRHRLSKQRRVGGLRSVVSNDFVPESHVDERNQRGPSQRISRHASSHESSLSSRLRGRVKFPGRSAGDERDGTRDREMDRERSLGRQHQGRLRDRLKGRLQEENSDLGRSSYGPRMRRETREWNDADFAGPRSFAEIKSTGQQIRGRESSPVAVRQQHPRSGDQQSEDLSFEGPKPLSVLLKRKREAETAAFSKGGPPVDVEGNSDEMNDSGMIESSETPANAHIHVSPSQSKEDGLNCRPNGEEGMGLTTGRSSPQDDPNPAEKKDGMIGEDAGGEQEIEGEYQEDGEYEYEQADEGEYVYDGENADEEYVEYEEGDEEFDKKDGENADEEYDISGKRLDDGAEIILDEDLP